MLVICAAAQGDGLRWSGRRHDDDGPGVSQGSTAQELFDAVFHALHDGEQVAIGFPAPLSVAAGADPTSALTEAESQRDDVRQLAWLVTELGRWRPWTVASTSLPRWRATTSVLVWETDAADLDAAVEAFFGIAHDDHGAEDPSAEVVNLAAAAAVRSELTVDDAQLHEPLVLVRIGG